MGTSSREMGQAVLHACLNRCLTGRVHLKASLLARDAECTYACAWYRPRQQAHGAALCPTIRHSCLLKLLWSATCLWP